MDFRGFNWILKILFFNLIIACLFTTYKYFYVTLSGNPPSQAETLQDTSELLMNSLVQRYSGDIQKLFSGLYFRGDSEYYVLQAKQDGLSWNRFCQSDFGFNFFRFYNIPTVINFSNVPALSSTNSCTSTGLQHSPQMRRKTLVAISVFKSHKDTIKLLKNLEWMPLDCDIIVIDDSGSADMYESLIKLVSFLDMNLINLRVLLSFQQIMKWKLNLLGIWQLSLSINKKPLDFS